MTGKKEYSYLKSMLFHKLFIFKKKDMVSEVQTLYLNFFIKHKIIHHPRSKKLLKNHSELINILQSMDTQGDRQRDGLIYEIWLHYNIVIININIFPHVKRIKN